MGWFEDMSRFESILMLYWAAVAVCIAVLVALSINARRLRWRVAMYPNEPQCGRCHYIMLPGGPTRCPECGADVRVSGLITPSTGPRPHAAPWFVLAALLMTPIALYLSAAVRWFPVGWDFQVICAITAAPNSTEEWMHQVTISAQGTGRYFGKRIDFLRVEASGIGANGGSGVDSQFFVRPTDLTVQEWNDTHTRLVDMPFTEEKAEKWLSGLKPEARARLPSNAAAQLRAKLQSLAAGEFSLQNSYNLATINMVSYRLNRLGSTLVFLSSYCVIFAISVTLVTFLIKRADQRLHAAWRSEAARFRLSVPEPLASEATLPNKITSS